MKKLLLFLLAGLFLFSACELEEEQDYSFVGTWSGDVDMGTETINMTIILAKSTYEMVGFVKGSLDADGSYVTLTPTHVANPEDGLWYTLAEAGMTLVAAGEDDLDSELSPSVLTWSVSGDILTITDSDDTSEFTRQ
jgi:hypothetical protein